MRLRILGECVIELGGHEYTPSAPHFFALLLRLGADAGRYFRRQEIAQLLFPHAPSERAALHSARQLIYQATQRGAGIEKANGALTLNRASVSIDLDDALARERLHDGQSRRTLAVLPGYAPRISEEFDEWLDGFRQHQHSRLRHALIESLAALRTHADWRAVELRAEECLAFDPYSEPATLALAEALAHTGSKERALATLDAYTSEVGPRDVHIAIPAALLRRRIEVSEARPANDAAISLVGRGNEMAALHEQSAKACAGAVQFTLIRGEAGSGKSRLMEEFRSMTGYAGTGSIAVVHSVVADRFRPFALVADLVPLLLRLPGAAGCDPNLLPFLRRLTDVQPRADEASSPGEADFVSAGIKRAVADLLDALSNERPCLVLIEDSRAIDDISLALLHDLAAATAPLRVHFVIACTDAEHREGVSTLASRTIVLKPLLPDSSRELLATALAARGSAISDDAMTWCVTVAAGNPAFLMLLAARGAAASVRSDIPRDIVAAVDNRLGSLRADALRVLEACAVLGDSCQPLMLGEVLGIEPFALVRALDELERAGLLESSGEHLLLRSALFRDRILASASTAVVSLLHGRCALALETRADSLNYWRIASHWRSAGHHQKARATLSASWRKSLQLGQPAQAEASIREYLALTVDSSERVVLYDDLIEVLQVAGNYPAIVAAIDERAALLRASNAVDARNEALMFDRLEAELRNHSDPSRSEEYLLASMRSSTLDNARRLRAAVLLLVSADATVNLDLAKQVHRELPNLAVNDSVDRVYLNQSLLIYHSVFGSKVEALSLANSVFFDARLEPNSWPHIRARLNAAVAMQLCGDPKLAFANLEQLYQQVLASGALTTCLLVAARLASIALDRGELDVAEYWARMAKSHVIGGISGRFPTDYLSVQADLSLLAGDFELARSMIAAMRDETPIYESPRYKMEMLSYALRLAHFEQTSPIDEADVLPLLEWHFRARAHGRHDDVMESLWVSLVSIGKQALASELLLEYLCHHRRESSYCRYLLRTRTAQDPAWDVIGSPSPSLG